MYSCCVRMPVLLCAHACVPTVRAFVRVFLLCVCACVCVLNVFVCACMCELMPLAPSPSCSLTPRPQTSLAHCDVEGTADPQPVPG